MKDNGDRHIKTVDGSVKEKIFLYIYEVIGFQENKEKFQSLSMRLK